MKLERMISTIIFSLGIVLMFTAYIRVRMECNELEDKVQYYEQALAFVQFDRMNTYGILRQVLYSEDPAAAVEKTKDKLDYALAFSIQEALYSTNERLQLAEEVRNLRRWCASHPEEASNILKRYDLINNYKNEQ